MPDRGDTGPDASTDEQDDPEEIAAAYEALEEDRRQRAPLTSTDTTPASPQLGAAPPPGVPVGSPQHPAPAANAESVQPKPAVAAGSTQRVFLIDGKEYPDPDASLPITGVRSVQAMYRDYFPGQLENADVLQKTRPDGTLEVTFRRRIGTKGRLSGARRRTRSTTSSGEITVDVNRIVRVLQGLPEDWPLVWRLFEQALGPTGEVRLDYAPPAADLNLAEAQISVRTRLIELAVGELGRLRPSL
jgi:hypothetical protein